MPPCICRKIAHVINGGYEAHECFLGQNFLNEVSYFLGGVGYMWQPGRGVGLWPRNMPKVLEINFKSNKNGQVSFSIGEAVEIL